MNTIDLRSLTEEEFTKLTQAQVVDLLSKYLQAGGDPAVLSDTTPGS